MNIPDEYKVKLTMEFMSQFFHELHDIFGTSLTPSGGPDYYKNRLGWEWALKSACEKCNCPEFYQYYTNLPLKDLKELDNILCDRFAELKLVLPIGVDILDFIALHTRYKKEELDICPACGRINSKSYMKEFPGVFRDKNYYCIWCVRRLGIGGCEPIGENMEAHQNRYEAEKEIRSQQNKILRYC